jgi:DNA-binding MarR family transcriptional regulator
LTMPKGSPVEAKRGFLARSPTPLFLFLCFVGALVGGVATFFVVAVGIAIFDAAMAHEGGSYEPVLLALATVFGFIIPPIILTRKRRAARRQSQTADTQQPLSVVIDDSARTAAPVENDSRINLSYQAPSSPPPLDQETSASRKNEAATLIPLAADVVPRNADVGVSSQKTRPHLIRRLIGPLAFLIIAVSLIAFFFAGGEPGLELSAGYGSIIITNLKNDPAVKIIDIVVNGRDECSTESALALCRQMPNAQNLAFLQPNHCKIQMGSMAKYLANVKLLAPVRKAADGRMGAQSFDLDSHIFYLFGQIFGHRNAALNRELRQFEIDYPRWRVLALLGQRPDCSMLDLADGTAVDRTTLAYTVRNMVEEGLVRRAPRPSDRRSVVLGLTPRGVEWRPTRCTTVSATASASRLVRQPVQRIIAVIVQAAYLVGIKAIITDLHLGTEFAKVRKRLDRIANCFSRRGETTVIDPSVASAL